MTIKYDPKSFVLRNYNPVLVQALVATAVNHAGENALKYVREELAKADRIDTGKLADSFYLDYTLGPLGPQIEVKTDLDYALWVELGTGPRIYPRNAKMLRFNPNRRSSSAGRRGVSNNATTGRFQSEYLFRPSVAGQPATHFFEKAMKRLSLADFIT